MAKGRVKLTLKQAEEKLREAKLEYGMKLRTAYENPKNLNAEDVCVQVDHWLERGSRDPKRIKLANEAAQEIFKHMWTTFSCPPQDAQLVLKIHLCDVSAGDRETRILAYGSGVGLVRLCLAWTLSFADGSVVLDGGRIGGVDHHMFGVWDVLRIKNGERTLLYSLVPDLCKKVKQRISIKSGRWAIQGLMSCGNSLPIPHYDDYNTDEGLLEENEKGIQENEKVSNQNEQKKGNTRETNRDTLTTKIPTQSKAAQGTVETKGTEDTSENLSKDGTQ